jgi:hypothetical protein
LIKVLAAGATVDYDCRRCRNRYIWRYRENRVGHLLVVCIDLVSSYLGSVS